MCQFGFFNRTKPSLILQIQEQCGFMDTVCALDWTAYSLHLSLIKNVMKS